MKVKKRSLFLLIGLLVLLLILIGIDAARCPSVPSVATPSPSIAPSPKPLDSSMKAPAFDIPPYISKTDMDGDGIDDQTDILQNVRAYIETAPMYQSKYYTSGYPNDGYGVCTDVIAFGLLGAGYDLQKRMNEDIQAHPAEYGITEPDKNIDFRRVKNQRIYFERTAISLTTDTSKAEEWQGGDIVVFPKHIGIVSDRRNKHGVPYLIHHFSPTQKGYEHNILEGRNDIVAHFRIS